MHALSKSTERRKRRGPLERSSRAANDHLVRKDAKKVASSIMKKRREWKRLQHPNVCDINDEITFTIHPLNSQKEEWVLIEQKSPHPAMKGYLEWARTLLHSWGIYSYSQCGKQLHVPFSP